jgi:hypothetical protein
MREVKSLLPLFIAIVAIALAGTFWWENRGLKDQLRATEATMITMKNMAEVCDTFGKFGLRSTNVSQVAESLRQVTPWASTPRWGAPPNASSPEAIRNAYAILERVRLHNQSLLLQRLRQLTSENLGDDPRPWLEKYAKLSFRPLAWL